MFKTQVDRALSWLILEQGVTWKISWGSFPPTLLCDLQNSNSFFQLLEIFPVDNLILAHWKQVIEGSRTASQDVIGKSENHSHFN